MAQTKYGHLDEHPSDAAVDLARTPISENHPQREDSLGVGNEGDGI